MTDNVLNDHALLRDLRRAIATGTLEVTPDGGLSIPKADVMMGGIFRTAVKRLESVQRAIDDLDPDKELWERARGLLLGGPAFELGVEHNKNRVPTLGLNLILNLLFRSRTQIATWYYGPFLSNWTPAATAGSNWAGATGALATELAVAQMVSQATRKASTFGSDADAASVTTSANSEVTLTTGVSGLTWYGLTLNESNAVAYNATDKILLSAAKRTEALSGLGAGDTLVMGYVFAATSS